MEKRRVPMLPFLATLCALGAMIGLLFDDPDTQFLATLVVLLGSAIVVNWIEAR
jgi:hypothetical protein